MPVQRCVATIFRITFMVGEEEVVSCGVDPQLSIRQSAADSRNVARSVQGVIQRPKMIRGAIYRSGRLRAGNRRQRTRGP